MCKPWYEREVIITYNAALKAYVKPTEGQALLEKRQRCNNANSCRSLGSILLGRDIGRWMETPNCA